MSTKEKAEAITARIIDALEKAKQGDRGHWELPWHRISGFPRNGLTGRAYQGVNTILLWLAGYEDLRWYTFNAVKKAGLGSVRKGEKGTQVVFWKPIVGEVDTQDPQGNTVTQRVNKGMFLRVFTVFNHAQIEWEEGKEPIGETPVVLDAAEEVLLAEQALLRAGATIKYGARGASYNLEEDIIRMPRRGSFKGGHGYVATMAHEHMHWTGHESRLKRDLSGRFGSESYAAEELVAELGSAFWCAEHGIQNPGLDAQHTAYLMSWVKVLKDDPYAIFTAARLAREALSFLNGSQSEAEEDLDAA